MCEDFFVIVKSINLNKRIKGHSGKRSVDRKLKNNWAEVKPRSQLTIDKQQITIYVYKKKH